MYSMILRSDSDSDFDNSDNDVTVDLEQINLIGLITSTVRPYSLIKTDTIQLLWIPIGLGRNPRYFGRNPRYSVSFSALLSLQSFSVCSPPQTFVLLSLKSSLVYNAPQLNSVLLSLQCCLVLILRDSFHSSSVFSLHSSSVFNPTLFSVYRIPQSSVLCSLCDVLN